MPALAKYRGPWQGVDSSKPANIIDPAASQFINNFILKDGEIRTRPRLLSAGDTGKVNPNRIPLGLGVLPNGTNYYARNLETFILSDTHNGIYVYTMLLDNKTLWYWDVLAAAPTWAKAGGGDLPEVDDQVFQGPKSWVEANQFLWFCTTNAGKLYKYDIGNNLFTTQSTIAGARFLTELTQQLIMANTVEAAGYYFNRVRWSAVGNFGQLDTALDLTAGFNDLLDCPDLITGLNTLGKTGYIYRTNGITEMIPTGSGANPFEFVHISNANNAGVGAYYPSTLADNGLTSFFCSYEDIWAISSGGLQPISGKAKDAIFADFRKAVGSSQLQDSLFPVIIGSYVPMFRRDYVYPLYILTIPIGSVNKPDTIFWIYSINDGTWTRWVYPDAWVTARIRYSQIGNQQGSLAPLNKVFPESYQFAYVPILRFALGGTGKAELIAFSTDSPGLPTNIGNGLSYSSFDTEQAAEYNFKIEEIDTDKKATIRRLRVLYRNLGVAKVTFTIYNNTTKPVAVTQTLGDTTADLSIRIQHISLISTGTLPQVKITREANWGPLSIIGLDTVAVTTEGETL